MNRLRFALLAPAVLFAACTESPVMPAAVSTRAMLSQAPDPTGYVVSFKNDRIPSSFAGRVAALGGTVTAAFDGAGLATVDGITDAQAASLSDFGEVAPDATFQIINEVPSEATAVDMEGAVASQSDPAGAFFFSRQWNMRLIGADKAWAAGKLGSPSVKVAILDTGIDPFHADLAGLVDFANSTSFVPSDNVYVDAFFPGRPYWTDLHYHGTHVAATVSSNGLAAAGVTSRTTLMAVKVLNVNGSGTTSAILNGIIYAADHGADVISMSLGNANPPFTMKDKELKDFFNKVVDRAFKYAHSKGTLVVVAAGNESQDLAVPQSFKLYCSSMHAICVSAVGPTGGAITGPFINPDAFASYSNFGTNQIDVAAPGGNFLPVTAACSGTSLQLPVCQTGTFVVGISGTSMATPHVSGLAAMLLADKGVGNGAVRSAIFNSAVDLGAPGKDALFGNGRISASRAFGLP
jgi:subtilisin family serine protease